MFKSNVTKIKKPSSQSEPPRGPQGGLNRAPDPNPNDFCNQGISQGYRPYFERTLLKLTLKSFDKKMAALNTKFFMNNSCHSRPHATIIKAVLLACIFGWASYGQKNV